ncbi:MAG: hypothetical protein KDJ76_15530 [Xanthobacteraceae bacterium]|nr:hypothetical protein [Xanthobacteraceae bacterium]
MSDIQRRTFSIEYAALDVWRGTCGVRHRLPGMTGSRAQCEMFVGPCGDRSCDAMIARRRIISDCGRGNDAGTNDSGQATPGQATPGQAAPEKRFRRRQLKDNGISKSKRRLENKKETARHRPGCLDVIAVNG